jgi:hypothetical protein
MGAIGNFVRSLIPGNDHELAATQYADRESASDRAARKDAERAARAARENRATHRRNAVKADRKGQAWGDRQRRRSS